MMLDEVQFIMSIYVNYFILEGMVDTKMTLEV